MPTPFLSSEEYDERAHQLYNEGQYEEAVLRCFRRTLEFGYADDLDRMLQIGRALFREASLRDRRELFAVSQEFFEVAVQQAPESAEAIACVGYAQHRLGEDDAAIASLRKSLQVDNEHAEARIYLANILYDRGDYEASLYHFERTSTEDHWDELGIWRLIELKRAAYKLEEHDDDLKPWEERLTELGGDFDHIDEAFIEGDGASANESGEVEVARGQLELFGTLLSSLADSKAEDGVGAESVDFGEHSI